MYPTERAIKLGSVLVVTLFVIVENVSAIPADSSDPAEDDGTFVDNTTVEFTERVMMCPNKDETPEDCIEDTFIFILKDGVSINDASEMLMNMTSAEGDDFEIGDTVDHAQFKAIFAATANTTAMKIGADSAFDDIFMAIAQDRAGTVSDTDSFDPADCPKDMDNVICCACLNEGVDRLDQEGLPLDNIFNPRGSGLDIPIYIVDTGVFLEHDEFEGRASNFYKWPLFLLEEKGIDFSDNHGTGVASQAAGMRYGVAKRARILNVKISGKRIGGRVWGSIAGTITGLFKIFFAGDRGVINMSVIFPRFIPLVGLLRLPIFLLVQKGFVIVTAAGNLEENIQIQNACLFLPGALNSVITVAATDIDSVNNVDKVSTDLTKTGDCVDIFSVGSNILAADTDSVYDCTVTQGTSFSSPQVAGAAALIMRDRPELSPQQIYRTIMERALQDVIADVPDGTVNRLLQIPSASGGGGITFRDGSVRGFAMCDSFEFPVQLDGDACEDVPNQGDLACSEGAFCQMTSDNPNDANFMINCCNPCNSDTSPAGFCRLDQKAYDCAFGFTCVAPLTTPPDTTPFRGVCCPGFSTGFPCPFDGVPLPTDEPFCLAGSAGTCGVEGYFCSPLSGRCCPDLFLFGGVPKVEGNPCYVGRPFVPPITCKNHYDCPAFSGWQFCQQIETDKKFGVYGICCDASIHEDAYKPNPCPLGFALDVPANCSGNVDCPDDFFCTPLGLYYKPDECVCCPKITAIFDNPCPMGDPLDNIICKHDTDCPKGTGGTITHMCTLFPGREIGACCLREEPIKPTTHHYYYF